MLNTEQEFWLLSELITMDDRALAKCCEMLIWDATGSVHQETLSTLVNLIVSSETEAEFHARLPGVVEGLLKARRAEEGSGLKEG